MKKVYVIAPFEVNGRYKGGVSFVAIKLCNYLKEYVKSEYEFHTINTCIEKRKAEGTGKFNFANIKNMLKFKKICVQRTADADIAYLHSSFGLALLKDLIVLRAVKRKNKVKSVLHIHYAEYKKILTCYSAVNYVILSLLRKYVDKIIFLSSNTRDEFVNYGKIAPEKTEVIYNFCDIIFSEAEIKEKLSNFQDGCKLLFMGSIDRRKGLVELLKATENIENITLDICGGVNDPEVEAIMNEYLRKDKKKYRFCGYVSGEEKKQLLYKSDIFVLPSYEEGMPIGIIEALAAGCAVITTNVGAIPEVFSEENGCIIGPNDIESLSGAIKSLAENEKNIKYIGMNNWIYSKEFQIDTFATMVLKTFE